MFIEKMFPMHTKQIDSKLNENRHQKLYFVLKNKFLFKNHKHVCKNALDINKNVHYV